MCRILFESKRVEKKCDSMAKRIQAAVIYFLVSPMICKAYLSSITWVHIFFHVFNKNFQHNCFRYDPCAKMYKGPNWRVFSNYLIEMNIFYTEYLIEMQYCSSHGVHWVKKCQTMYEECFYRATIFTWAKCLRTFRIISDLIFYVSYLSVNKIG